MIRESIETLVNKHNLSDIQSSQVMNEIMSGEATPAQFGAFVTAMRIKGETPDEIAGMAKVMRDKSLKVQYNGDIVDTCGTGGDASNTFNISTTAAFVVSGVTNGAIVAKHGNRAMSSTCGSADVLEALGVNINLSPESVRRCLEEVKFGFMFAQRYHPSMKFAAPSRIEIGIRTVFNILGPLTNPAGAKTHLIGVSDSLVGEKIVQVLQKLGSTHALVVHGMDGLDEITISDATQVWELVNNSISTYMITPEDLGFNRVPRETIQAGNIQESTQMLLDILNGEVGPARNVVLMNAAAALLAANKASTLSEGVKMATQSIDSGQAREKLGNLVSLSQTLQ